MSMTKRALLTSGATLAVALAAFGGRAISLQDKYTLQVPGGLAFSEFKGYERLASSRDQRERRQDGCDRRECHNDRRLGEGVPGNGEPFPDGAKMAKIHWTPKTQETYPGQPRVPGTQDDVDFMVKDNKRFADSGGWGCAVFNYDAGSDTFTPATVAAHPPQEHDAQCGFACHTVVKKRDYVFTDYGHR